MSEAKTPKRPRGPPPAHPPSARPPPLADSGQTLRGVGELKKPPGPPPGTGVPITKLKPPPMAPPPLDMSQSAQRPFIQNVREIDLQKGLSSKPSVTSMKIPQPLASDGTPGRGPPPRGAVSEMEATDFVPTAGYGLVGAGMKVGSPTKYSYAKSSAMRKAGAISMFEEPIKAQAQAESKDSTDENKQEDLSVNDGQKPMVPIPMRNAPRPIAPVLPPPGVPAGLPFPPNIKPAIKAAPAAPVRPAPNRGRAPPREEPPEDARVKVPGAPNVEPPFKRGYKEPTVVLNKKKRRHEKDDPEFEESSDEEEEEVVVKEIDAIDKIANTNADDEAELEMYRKKFGVTSPTGSQIDEGIPPLPTTDGVGMALQRNSSSVVSQLENKEESVRSVPVSAKVESKASIIAPLEPPPPVPTQRDTARSVTFSAPPPPSSRKFTKSMVDSVATSVTGTSTSIVPRPGSGGAGGGQLSKISESGKSINGGRFNITCIEGIEIFRDPAKKDSNVRMDPFLKFKLGAADKLPWKKTQTQRKCDSNPHFERELISFDTTDMSQYLFDDDVVLYIQVWNNATTRDEHIASVVMSSIRFFHHPYMTYKETIPLQSPSGKPTSGKLVLEFTFEEARPGMLVFTLFECRGLRSVSPLGHQDPFVEFKLGPNYTKKSKVIKEGGKDPYFEEEEVVMWVDGDIWTNDLVVSVCDESVGVGKPIGSSRFSVLGYMDIFPSKAQVEGIDLFYIDDSRGAALAGGEPNEVPKGQLFMKVTFLPAGRLTVRCLKAKDLLPPASKDTAEGNEIRMDPYVSLSMEGQAAKIVKRSTTDKDGGRDPVWECPVYFDVVDQYLIDVEVFDQDMSGTDILLGTSQISLLPVFKAGELNIWLTLRLRREGLGVKDSGDINFSLSFVGPPNIAYPQYRQDIDSFDDTLRALSADKIQEANLLNANEKKSAGGIEDVMTKLMPALQTQEFTDEEIVAAFKFIDLNHNNFIGAAEIRHILVCMGELITDEEIDMMLSMVDIDGDGQVSFQEFRTLVLHPSPGDVDFHRIVQEEQTKNNIQLKLSLTGKQTKDMDVIAYQRQKEMTLRESKKKMLISFIADNEMISDTLVACTAAYFALPREKRVNGRINFESFCRLTKIEPIGEYLKLFGLFDPEEQGFIDFREFLLSSMNFVNIDKEERIRLAFEMYDENKTGYISEKEIIDILKGNHMLGLASVQRKAQTVMKQVTASSNGAMTLNEFVIISKKFPNIMLPVVNSNNSSNLKEM